jgi:hypothetical protein
VSEPAQPMSNPLPISSYRDRTPSASRQFTLYPDRLVIRGRVGWSGEFDLPIALTRIYPVYGVTRSRSEIAGPGAIILGAVFGFLFAFGLKNGRPEFFPVGAVMTATLAALFLTTGVRNFPRIERYVFRSTDGAVVFDIARSGPDRERLDEFAQQVVAAVRASQPAPPTD